MTDASSPADLPWRGDACSLVDAFRRGERSPREELTALYAAIDVSDLNATCHEPREQAFAAAAAADVQMPFGGVPIGVKELDTVEGWPDTEACVVLQDRIATDTSVMVDRLRRRGGAVLAAQTTASEFGGVNVTRTVLHGVTRNPWSPDRTPGGSSGGSAAAVAGGLMTLATAGDGGGSIRIPAGFTGTFGLKATYGRIPLAPRVPLGNLTVTVGCISRSVRDTARWFDVCSGPDGRDQFSHHAPTNWEAGLDTNLDAIRGMRVAVVADWGGATLAPEMWDVLAASAERLIATTGMRRVEGLDTSLPRMGAAWSISGSVGTYAQIAHAWPACAEVLTPEIRGTMRLAERYGLAERIKFEARRMSFNERMGAIFDAVDFVITASNPDVAFAAEGPLPKTFGGLEAGAGNNGLLTFPANMFGNPAVSIPAGAVAGLPVGLQIIGRHHSEPLLLDLARVVERDEPWPLVAPSAAA